MQPEIINYLLTIRYPDSDPRRLQPVCYMGAYQLLIPLFMPGQTVNLVARPLHGVYAWIMYCGRLGSEMVPNVFTLSGSQYGNFTYSGICTQRWINDSHEFFVLVTDQEPSYASMTNISPLAQMYEGYSEYVAVPTPADMEIISDALRRLHTSKVSESLLQQAANLLGVIAGQPQEPKPPLGGS